jgi:PAS domain-containing protein
VHPLDSLPCPVLVTGRDGRVVSLNQNLLDLAGRTRDGIVNHPMEQLFPVASRILLQTHIWPLLLSLIHI